MIIVERSRFESARDYANEDKKIRGNLIIYLYLNKSVNIDEKDL